MVTVDKIKKFLIIPVVYHMVIFIAMVCLSMMKDVNLNIVALWLADMGGCIVWAMFFAVMSIVHAILHEAKVYDYLYICLAMIFVIGMVRVIVYKIAVGTGALLIAAGLGAATLGIFVVWDCLFAVTDHMMKKRPGRKNRS